MNKSSIHNFTFHTMFESNKHTYISKKYSLDHRWYQVNTGFFHRIICRILYK